MHSSRRRKKRLNYGVRTVEVERGPNGFGFTISGQQPCILSCIVTHSPADVAGLRAGDFLISVNGISVSKLAHDAVVNLIGNCFGPIQMTIAENYYSDSSDEEAEVGRMVNSRKLKHHNYKTKGHKGCNNKFEGISKRGCGKIKDYINSEKNSPGVSYEVFKTNNSATNCAPIEYKAIVGYLGTIEMPKQLPPNSRLTTVVNCIRKFRQEKRIPTAVLMTILPTCLTLKNVSNHVLAIYPTDRVVYVNSPSDKDSRYFGLVTSTTTNETDESPENEKANSDGGDVVVSNSCHVFVVDSKIAEHDAHAKKAENFKVTCTMDVVTGTCLEFPRNAIYLVKLIRNMYCLEDVDSESKNNEELIANSPQPSASSNSDSGIGYRDECGNISDRILVVEFPSHRPSPILPNLSKRPSNIIHSNHLALNPDGFSGNGNINNIRAFEGKLERHDYDTIYNRLTVRVMPNSSILSENFYDEDNFPEKNVEVQEIIVPSRSETASLRSLEGDIDFRSSVDNVSMYSSKSAELSNSKGVFKTPSNKYFELKRQRKYAKPTASCDNIDKCDDDRSLNYKLSPKVYGIPKPTHSCEELNSCDIEKHCFGSLQDLTSWYVKCENNKNITQSYPDVRVEKKMHSPTNLRNELNSEGPASWATSFEKLLECTVGLHTFAEFLKKEFSAENIYFWTACERFKLLPIGQEKKTEAARIFKRHLCIGSSEAVNVDSQARSITEQSLDEADNKTFELAQKQIFNLMKFDSYPRFLKSDLYKRSLSGSSEYPELDTRLLIQPPPSTASIKLKKSLSNAEDRRRKSLLPWNKKNRSKSKDRGDVEWSEKEIGSQQTEPALSRQQMLCRVILNSGTAGSTTVVQIRDSESVQQLVDRLLEKRGLTFYSYDVTTDKSSKPIDVKGSSQTLVGCEVYVERKVTFKLDLPNRKIISVKSKHTKVIADVLKHILQRYGFSLSEFNITNGEEIVDIEQTVMAVENCRLSVSAKPARPSITSNAVKMTVVENAKMLDEITNKVYKDILQGKTEVVKAKSDRSSVKSEDWGSDHSSSIIGRFLRRDSALLDRKKKLMNRNKGTSTNSSVEDVNDLHVKKPLIAKWKSGAKLQTACSESDELYEGLSRAQRSRLEDQRGTEINFELPDFLKDKENSKQSSEKLVDNSKFYASGYLDRKCSRNGVQEYENHVVGNLTTSEDSSTSNGSSPTKNNLNVTVIEKTPTPHYGTKVMEPPPLPPKPKIVPIRPSNWGQGDYASKKEAVRKAERKEELFLEQPTSSFV